VPKTDSSGFGALEDSSKGKNGDADLTDESSAK
jgi:hypothetical protein